MSDINVAPANGAPRALSKLERRRLEVEAKRNANTVLAEALAEERELALLDDEEACEEEAAKAYSDPSIGPDRCIGPGLIKGAGNAGFVLFKWPDPVEWTHFQNKGILKPNSLTTDLADQLTCKCVLYPSLERWREIMRRNPTASFQVATQIMEAMAPAEAEAGKGLRSSHRRR